jgi:hypothetical protein
VGLLDPTGIWRKKGSVEDVADVRKVLDGRPDQQRALRALYGGGRVAWCAAAGWRSSATDNTTAGFMSERQHDNTR